MGGNQMTMRVEKVRRKLDGVYQRTRAMIVSEYAYHPVRFFSIFVAIVVGLGVLSYFGPIRAQVNEFIAKSSNNTAPIGDNLTKASSPTDPPLTQVYFKNNETTLAANAPMKIPLAQATTAPRVEVRQVISGEIITDQFTISSTDDGKNIELEPNYQVRSGKYEVTAKNPNSDVVIAQKTVTWGVLAFNPDYAVYPADTEANFAMAVLDDRGKMVCGADMTLEVTDPQGKITTLSIKDQTIINSPDCLVYGPTTEPDYYAKYLVGSDGEYKIKLVATVGDGKRTLEDSFFVKSNQDFYIKRSLPTRIYPPINYDVQLTLEAKKTGHYSIMESVPTSFEISKTEAKVDTKESTKSLQWEFDAESGQSKNLSYTFKAPNLSPYLFTVGPAKVTLGENNWREPRSWQIASDNACQSAATGNWSDSANWTSCGGTVPQAADTVQILNTHNITEDTASVTVAGITIDNGGTLTVSTTNAITVSGNWSNSGTFTAASGTVTFSATATGKTLSGTMTGATGKFYNIIFNGSGGGWTLQAAIEAANDFTLTLGTFDTKSGSNYAVTVTNDLTIGGGTFTARNSIITVSRHWTLNTGGTFTRGGSTVVLDGTGNIAGSALTQFQHLSIGYSGKTTTLTTTGNRTDAFGTLTFNGGTVTSSATYSFYSLMASAGTYTPIVFASATTLSGSSVTLYYRATVTSVTINIAGADHGTWNVSPYASAGNSNIWNFAGNVTTTGTFQPFAATGITGTTVNTQNFSLTAKRINFGATGANLGPIAFNLGSSAVTLSNGTSDAILLSNVAVTHTLDMGSSSIDVKGNVLFVNGSASVTVTPGTSTLTWTNTSGTLTYAPNGQSLYNLVLNGSGSTVTPNAAVDIDNDLTMTAGTLNGTQNITVNGTVAGTAGIISLTGGTFEQRVAAAENFGTTSGSTAWTFSTLTFSNSSGSAATITTQTGGTGGITISSILNVGKAADTAKTVFNAGNRTYTMSSTGGNPIVADADGNGSSITGSTSTFSFTGANGSGNTTIEKNTGDSYYNITLNAADTFVLEGATTATGAVTITTGTLDTVAGSDYALTAGTISIAALQALIANNSTITLTGTSGTLFTKSGSFTQGDSTVIVTSASGTPTLLSAATTFHILTINAAATVVNAGAGITTDNDAGNKFYVQTGVFNLEGQTITPGTSGTLEVSSTGTFCLGGTTSATNATCDSGATQTSASTFPAFTTITLNATSTVIYLADAAQTVSNTPTYGNLKFTPVLTAGRSYTFGGAATINGDFTINPSAGSALALTVNLGGTTTVASTKTATVTASSSATSTLDTVSGSNHTFNTGTLTIGSAGTFETRSSTVAITSDATTNGTLQGSGNITVNGHVAGTGTVTLTGGTFEQRIETAKNFGTTSGSTVWTFNDLTFSHGVCDVPGTATITTQTGGSGGLTISGILRIGKSGDNASCPTALNAGNRTWTLSGTGGDPFQLLLSPAGVLTASTSTFTYTGVYASGNTTVQAATYYNLDVNNASETYAQEANTAASNDFSVTNGAYSTSVFNYTLTVTRDFTLADAAGAIFTANGSTITVSRHWTKGSSATFTRGTSTVQLNGDGSILGGLTQFNNLTAAYSGKTTTMAIARTDAFGVLTLGSGIMTCSVTCEYMLFKTGSGALVLDPSTTLTGSNATFHYRMLSATTSTVTAGTNHGTWNILMEANTTGIVTFNLGGAITTTGTIVVRADTGGSGSNFNTQNFTLIATSFSIGDSTDNTAIAANFGSSTMTLSNGTSDALFPASNGGSHTLNLSTSSVSVAGNVRFVNGTGTITVTPGTSTLTWTNTSGTLTYAPNGQSLYNMILNGSGSTVAPNAAVDVDNNLTITAGTLTAPSSLTIGGDYSNSGTFTHSSGTVTFNAIDTGNTLGGTLSGSSAFYNLIFNDGGAAPPAEWTPSAAVAVSNDLTMTAGSLLGTQNLTVSGGDITGDGTINLTGGTTTLTADGNFGGATAWTFYTLKFGNTSTLVPVETVTATGAGGITVTDVLTINKHSGLGCDMNTLNAGSKTWTLSGTTGAPLVVSGTLTPSTSTITFTGNNGAGNTSVPGTGATCGDATYNNLTLNNGSETYAVGGTTNITISSNLTVTAGTFTAGSGTTTIGGNVSNSGTFTANSGTVTLNGSGTQTLSGTLTGGSAFYNLIISNSSGAVSGCATSFTPGVDFAVAATISNLYTITTANVKVEYNSGSTYAVNDMNWNGGGTSIYFRNSDLSSGTWLLNVTAVGNAQDKVSYVDVGRSDASGGATIIASDGTNTDCSNNTNWQFDETLTLSLDSTSKDFGVVTPGSNPSDQTSTLTATSNAVNGYVIYAWSTQAMTNVRFGGVTLADWTGTNATPTAFDPGSYGFGYNTDDTSLTGGTADRFGSGPGAKFAGFTHSGPGDPVADRTAPATSATNTISYRLYPSASQADGDYTTIVIYVIVATFP